MPAVPTFAPFLVRRLWGPDIDGLPSGKRHGLAAGRIAYAVLRDVVEGRLSLHAGSLVYTTILSLVPILALSFSILKGFGVHYRFEPLLLNALKPLGPQAQVVADGILEFVDKLNIGVLGALGIALLFYTAISMAQKIEGACNDIWHVTEPRPLLRKVTDYISVLLIAPVLAFAAIGLATSVMSSEPVQQATTFWPVGLLLGLAERLLPVMMVASVFTILYKLMPYTRVPLVSALIGAAVAAVIWLAAGYIFARFTAGATSYAAIYSALAALVLFLLWLNTAWLIVLIGATIAFYHAHPEYLRLCPGEMSLSIRARERLALAALRIIVSRFYAGEPPPATGEIARQLGAPDDALADLLAAFEAQRLLARTAGEPSRWIPGSPAEETSLAKALEVTRAAGVSLPGLPEDRRLAALESALEDAMEAAVGTTRLRDFAADAAPPHPGGEPQEEARPLPRPAAPGEGRPAKAEGWPVNEADNRRVHAE